MTLDVAVGVVGLTVRSEKANEPGVVGLVTSIGDVDDPAGLVLALGGETEGPSVRAVVEIAVG